MYSMKSLIFFFNVRQMCGGKVLRNTETIHVKVQQLVSGTKLGKSVVGNLTQRHQSHTQVTDLKIFWTPARCHGATTAEVNSVKFMTTLTTQESKIESDQILRLEITVEQVLRELVLDSLFPDIFLQQEGYVQDATDKISEHAAKEIGYQRCTVRVFRKETVEHALDSGPEGHPGDSSQGTQTDTDGGLCILITSVLEIPNWQRKVEKFERDGIINSEPSLYCMGVLHRFGCDST